jgi:hypothetical protein
MKKRNLLDDLRRAGHLYVGWPGRVVDLLCRVDGRLMVRALAEWQPMITPVVP